MHTRTERILIISVILCGCASLAFVGPALVHAAPGKQVTVDNTAVNPVIVRDVDNAARHFFQASTGTLTNAFNPSGFGSTLTDVLGGQVLVIEYVSADCIGSQGILPGTLRLGTAGVDHVFALSPTTFPRRGSRARSLGSMRDRAK